MKAKKESNNKEKQFQKKREQGKNVYADIGSDDWHRSLVPVLKLLILNLVLGS